MLLIYDRCARSDCTSHYYNTPLLSRHAVRTCILRLLWWRRRRIQVLGLC